MKYISLFAGVGGFDLALNRLGHTCVYTNEWDKYAAQTYEKNFNQKPDIRDIRNVLGDEIPDHDILVGGFPCQSFSIAGLRGGFSDTRGTLFFEIARILKDKRPSYLLLENVKGLLSHDNGRTFETIMRTLDELGYDTQWQVLNSKNFGVPQNRERVFIIGHLRGSRRPKVFPFTESNSTTLKNIGGIPSEKWISNGDVYPKSFSQGNRVYSDQGIGSTIASQAGGRGAKTGLYQIVRPVITPDRVDKRQNGRRFKEDGEEAFTLTAQDRHGVMTSFVDLSTQEAKLTKESRAIQARYNKGYSHRKGETSGVFMYPHGTNPGGVKKLPNLRAHSGAIHNEVILPQIRRLTPTECERLQGFPDGFTEGVSNTQRYKQLGNAVTVNVIEAIMKRFMESIKE